jgi:hypothetical protein
MRKRNSIEQAGKQQGGKEKQKTFAADFRRSN